MKDNIKQKIGDLINKNKDNLSLYYYDKIFIYSYNGEILNFLKYYYDLFYYQVVKVYKIYCDFKERIAKQLNIFNIKGLII